MAVTLKQIAEISGVSIGTVCRALNNKGRINPKVAERIRNVAEELNYQPNSIAKSLSNKRKNLKIAVILHVTQNMYVDEMIEGVKQAQAGLKEAGISIVIKPCKDFNATCQLNLIDQAIENKVDGIVIIPIDHQIIKEKINKLSLQNFPIVMLSSFIEDCEYFAFVGNDNKFAGQIACGLLKILTHGKAKLAIVIPNLQLWSNKKRLKGILESIDRQLPEVTIESVFEISSDEIQSYIAVKHLLEENPQVDSVIYFTGAVSGGLRAIIEASKTREINIITSDLTPQVKAGLESGDIPFSIFQNPKAQGYRAVKILSDYLIANKTPNNKHIYVKTEILIKDSIEGNESLGDIYLSNL